MAIAHCNSKLLILHCWGWPTKDMSTTNHRLLATNVWERSPGCWVKSIATGFAGQPKREPLIWDHVQKPRGRTTKNCWEENQTSPQKGSHVGPLSFHTLMPGLPGPFLDIPASRRGAGADATHLHCQPLGSATSAERKDWRPRPQWIHWPPPASLRTAIGWWNDLVRSCQRLVSAIRRIQICSPHCWTAADRRQLSPAAIPTALLAAGCAAEPERCLECRSWFFGLWFTFKLQTQMQTGKKNPLILKTSKPTCVGCSGGPQLTLQLQPGFHHVHRVGQGDGTTSRQPGQQKFRSLAPNHGREPGI